MLTDGDAFFEGAKLHWEPRPVAATCLACGAVFEAAEPHPSCPRCSARQVRFDPDAAMLQLTDIGIVEEEDEATGGADG
jgi:Zn finger protein HypA/HybF involved in hydrogenase expression